MRFLPDLNVFRNGLGYDDVREFGCLVEVEVVTGIKGVYQCVWVISEVVVDFGYHKGRELARCALGIFVNLLSAKREGRNLRRHA